MYLFHLLDSFFIIDNLHSLKKDTSFLKRRPNTGFFLLVLNSLSEFVGLISSGKSLVSGKRPATEGSKTITPESI